MEIGGCRDVGLGMAWGRVIPPFWVECYWEGKRKGRWGEISPLGGAERRDSSILISHLPPKPGKWGGGAFAERRPRPGPDCQT